MSGYLSHNGHKSSPYSSVASRGRAEDDAACAPGEAAIYDEETDPRTVEALNEAVAAVDQRLRELTKAIAESAGEYALATRRLA